MMYGTTRTANTCLSIHCIAKDKNVLVASAVQWLVGGGRQREFMRWPAYEKMYISAFERMLEVRKKKGLDNSTVWANITTGEEMFHWWMEDDILPGQVSFDDIEEAMNAEI